jgi:hypothetical protein
MMYDGDGLLECAADLVVSTLKINGLIVINPTGLAHGKVQVKQA